jgi:hypothetical protein
VRKDLWRVTVLIERRDDKEIRVAEFKAPYSSGRPHKEGGYTTQHLMDGLFDTVLDHLSNSVDVEGVKIK